MIHTEITPTERADRLAIRELVDAYAHCADRRDAEGQQSLFTEDTHFVVYMNGQGSEPSQVLDGREALTPVFDDLNRYRATMHFNGQSTVALDGDRATGESYCIAPPPIHRRRRAQADGRVAAIRRHVREGRRGLAVRRAQPLRRLDRDSAFASLAPRHDRKRSTQTRQRSTGSHITGSAGYAARSKWGRADPALGAGRSVAGRIASSSSK
jgi:hypothetical protein